MYSPKVIFLDRPRSNFHGITIVVGKFYINRSPPMQIRITTHVTFFRRRSIPIPLRRGNDHIYRTYLALE